MVYEKYGDYELDSYDPVVLTLPDFTVLDQEVEDEMQRIASRHSTNITIDPHPVRADDVVLIDIVTKDGKNPFPGLTREHVDVQLGVGYLPEEIEEALLGHVVGDTVEAEFMYTDYSQVSSEAETPADGGCGVDSTGEPEEIQLVSKVTICAIRKMVTPEITDAWVAKNIARANTVEEFRANTKEKLSKQRRRKTANEVEYLVMHEVGKRLVGEPPAEIVDTVEKQMIREFDEFIEQFDMDRATYLAIQGLDDFQFAEQVRADARERVMQDVALASWARHFDIAIEDSDIDFMFGEPTPERTFEARTEAEATGRIDMFKDLALRAKVAQEIAREATYLAPDGSVDESFKTDVELKYHKQQMVRAHATSDPMLKPPMVAKPQN